MTRVVTYVFEFDNPCLTDMPEELREYLRPDGEKRNGVCCSTVSGGNAVKELADIQEKLGKLLIEHDLYDEFDEVGLEVQ